MRAAPEFVNWPEGLREVIEETGRTLKTVSVADVLTRPSPAPRFVWDGYAPRNEVTLLAAHGGTGKSTIALMLAVCAALGRPMFGVAVEQCNVVFLSLEDDAGVVRYRLAAICKAWGIDPTCLAGRLHILDGTGRPELYAADGRGCGSSTEAYAELSIHVAAARVGLVVVDNASDAFGGDEIQRLPVRGFIRDLAAMARANDAAVLLLAHVDKATSRGRKSEGGEGYSGSTAWNNSVRSRLFMTRSEAGDITLEHQKSNHGRLRPPMTLEWPEGGFPRLVAGDHPEEQGRKDDQSASALLRLIADFEELGQFCSPATHARTNVYAVLRSEPAFQELKLKPDDTRRIATQCQRAGWLEVVDYRSHDRKDRQRWAVTGEGRAFAGLPALSAPTAPTCNEDDEGPDGAGGAPSAPTCVGGMGDRARTDVGAETPNPGDKKKPSKPRRKIDNPDPPAVAEAVEMEVPAHGWR